MVKQAGPTQGSSRCTRPDPGRMHPCQPALNEGPKPGETGTAAGCRGADQEPGSQAVRAGRRGPPVARCGRTRPSTRTATRTGLAVPTSRDGQQTGVVVASGSHVEGNDLLVKPLPQGEGHSPTILGMLNENGTGVEQVEAPAMRVLLGPCPRLGDDDGHVVARDHGRRRAGPTAAWPAPRRHCTGTAPVSCATPSAVRMVALPAMTPPRSSAAGGNRRPSLYLRIGGKARLHALPNHCTTST
jgi:hypothetical protein